MQAVDLSKMTDIELKAIGWDIANTIDNLSSNLQKVKQELFKRQNEQVVKDEPKE
jgi:hypothetical protein